MKPSYRFVGREHRTDPDTGIRLSDDLIWCNRKIPYDTVIIGEWRFWHPRVDRRIGRHGL
jgi:hypothetical protein